MTNTIAKSINAGVLGVLLACAASAYGQNITFFRQYNIPPSYDSRDGFASDGNGGLYTLMSGALRRYDTGGVELWTRQIGVGTDVIVTSLAANASGVFVAGGTVGVLPGQTNIGKTDAFVRKYDPAGRELWTRQFGTVDSEIVQVMAADGTGIYVAGVGFDPSYQHFVSKFDGSGNQLWAGRFNAGGATFVNASADSTGVYIAFGHSEPPTVRRFDARGNELWTRQLDPSTGLRPVVEADESGAYILVLYGNAFSLRRYDQAGAESWVRQVWDPSSGATPAVLAADSTGVFVAGVARWALPGQCYAGKGDVFLTRFTSGGNQTWTRQFGTAGTDYPRGLGADGSNAYAFIYNEGAPGPDGRVASTSLARLEKESAPVTDSQPRILSECVLNAASYVGGGVAPGEIVTVLGSAMGPPDLARLQVTPDGRVPTTLAGVRILFDGEPAPLVYVSERQSSAIVPYGIAGKATVDVQVEYKGVLSSAVKMPVFESHLGVFSFGSSGSGQAAIVNEDGTVNSSFNPARRGSVVSIYGTGGGTPQPPGAHDKITGDNPSTHKSLAYLRLANDRDCDECIGFDAEVLYYGGAPRSVPGLVQINARLPLDVPAGDAVPLYFGLSAYTSVEQVVTVAIR